MAHYFRIDARLKLLGAFSPKCASCSINLWMDALACASGQVESGSRAVRRFVHAEDISEYPDYFSVLFLRDPMRRLVSFYANWVISRPGKWDFADHDRRFRLNNRSFRQFLFVLDHLDRHGLGFQHHLEPQSKNLQGMSFDTVVLTENLHQSLRSLNARLGCRVEDFHENQTDRGGQLREFVGDHSPGSLATAGIPEDQWFYDEEVAYLARRIYAEDIDLYQANGGVLLEPATSPQGDRPGPSRAEPEFMNTDEGHLGGYVRSRHPRSIAKGWSNGDPQTWFPGLWRWARETLKVESVLDVGCGEGHATGFFAGIGCRVVGIDGSRQALRDSVIPDRHRRHDFVDGPYIPDEPFDMIWSCEFVEHVEERYSHHFLATFASARKFILMTYAGPGQPGWHHVNCRPMNYWVDRIEELGFEWDEELTREAREQAGKGHFQRAGLVFVRKDSQRVASPE